MAELPMDEPTVSSAFCLPGPAEGWVRYALVSKKGGEIMRILFISLLLLTFVGCTYSNSNVAWHTPALYYNDSKALADLNLQQYLAGVNRQQTSVPSVNRDLSYTPYTILDW